MKDFAGKVAFITGGASGAGLGYAQIFSEAGMKVVIADFSQEHLDQAMAYLKETGAPVHAIKLDVTDREATAAAADETERVFGVPDLLILNAGVNTFGPAEATSYGDFDWVTGVNYGGVVNGLVTFVPRMIRAGGERHIAGTVSFGVFGPGPITAPYAAAKSAMLSLLESYWVSLKPYGIGVSAICPANIRSKIYEAALKGRPEKYGETGFNVTEATTKQLSAFHQNGMDPRVLGEWLKKGIEEGVFLIVPYEHGTRMVELAMERFKYYTTAEGIRAWEAKQAAPKTEEELMLDAEHEGYSIEAARERDRHRGEQANDDVGFGKARADLDWVEADKKVK